MHPQLQREGHGVLRRAAYLAQMLRNESRTPAALAAHQSKKLCALVRHAASKVPFYRDLYAAHGIELTSFKTLHDLQSLPMVDKQMLRAAGASAVSRDAPAQRVTIRTSGSTGEPLEFQIDHRYDQWRKAQYLRPYLSSGQRLRDKVLRLTAHPQRRTPWYARLGLLREWQFDCASDPARIVEIWRELAPQVLQGYPASLRALAHYCRDTGQPLVPSPRLVFADSSLLTPDTRAVVEQVFNAPLIDIFGTFETDNIAYQCAAHDGYHITTDSIVLEIVRDGRPVPIGEAGEIVVTVLGNRTMPFIRYNLKDIGRLSPHRCCCGLPFPLLAVIEGRANDLIALADGRHGSPAGILAHLTGFVDAIVHYQLRQIEIRRFELLIVPGSGFSDATREAIVTTIEAALEGAKLDVRLVNAIPADRSGKQRAFVAQLALDHRP
jgi:phenylacetate-CoA ligase